MNKVYKHIFAVIDLRTKTTSAKGVIIRLQMQSSIFGNPFQIVSDRGSAFTSDDFRTYCEEDHNFRFS